MNVERLRRRDDSGGVRCGVVAVSENTAVSVGIPRSSKRGVCALIKYPRCNEIAVAVLEGHLRSTERDHLADAFGTCVSVAVECYDGFIWRR